MTVLDMLEFPAFDISGASTTLLVCTSALLIIIFYLNKQSNRRRLPPGPVRLPVIGNLWYFLLKRKDTLLSIASDKRYGDIMTVYTPEPTVVLNSSEVIQEVYVRQGDKSSLRYFGDDKLKHHEWALTGGKGLHEVDGRWQPLRKLIQSVLRDHGVDSMEDHIITETKFFIQALKDTDGDPVDTHRPLLFSAIANIITLVIFGDRADYSDPESQLDNASFIEFFRAATLVSFLPFFKYIPGDPFGLVDSKRKTEAGVELIRRRIEQHKQTVDLDNPRDFIDSFLIEINRSGKSDEVFNDSNMLAAVTGLYNGGSDTTSVSLYWAFLYLMIQTESQNKIYQELQQVVGDREVRYSDRHEMHYTMSFITEVLRICVAIMSLPHCASEDIEIKGYTIPKGTVVIANLWKLCRDDRKFPHPETFCAERFLDGRGKFIKPDSKHFMPFSIGRRMCPGEQLARMEMFIFLVTTVRHFHLKYGQPEPLSAEGYRHFIYEPKPYLTRFILRT